MPIETDSIKAETMNLREGDPWQMACMELCTIAVDLFQSAAQVKPTNSEGDAERELVAMQVLGIRVLNSIGAADEMLLRGYYQPAAIMVRDMVECCFLLDLFSRAPEHLPKWIALGLEAGMKEYKPSQVRDLLNSMDGVGREVRGNVYTFYSRQGTHPNPAGVGLIAPNNQVEIGPFADAARLKGLTYDLTRFAVLAATHLSQWIMHVDLVEDDSFKSLGPRCEAISHAFLGLNDHLNKVKMEGAD